MRRKSTRNTAKPTPEKPAAETATRRSRRHSKRRKRSSSRSSSEGSDDVSLKTVAQQMAEVPVEEVPNINLPGEEGSEQSVWKVTPSAAPSGEIQKLKLCLTRPPPSSPEKTEPTGRRRRNKSGSQVDEDIASPEDKQLPRKAKSRSSPGANVEEVEELSEDAEDKKGKGKSKTKHKSKSEKTPTTQDLQDQTQSEISENVQVTPQSPQAAIDIRVDNESVSTIEHETVDTDERGTNSVLHDSNASDSCIVTPGSSDKKVAEEGENVNEIVVAQESVEEDDNINETVQPQSPGQDSASTKLQSVVSDSPVEVDFKGFDVPTETEMDQKQQPESVTEEVVVQKEVEPREVQELPEQEIATNENVEETEVQRKDDVIEEEVQEVQQQSASPVEPEIVVQSNDDNDMKEVCQEAMSPRKSENLENMDVQSEAKSGTEEIQISEEVEKQRTADDKSALEQQQSEEEHIAEAAPEPMQVEEVHQTPPRRESKSESSSSDEPETVEQKEEADEQVESRASPVHSKDESSSKSPTVEEPQRFDEDSRSADIIIIESSSTPNKDESGFNLSQSFSPDVRDLVEANKQLQSMKQEVRELFPTPSVSRRRKWTNTSVGLELLAPSLKKIDIDSIKQLCPGLQLLEEHELRMEIRESRDRQKSVSETRERKPERKVSIEHQSNDADHKRLETQDSVNSSEMEEATEPEVDNSNIIAMNRKISIVDDTASKLKPPPSPSKNPVSEVLYITNLVRPFTLKQLKELLERTGTIKENGFWTDRIKSKCYVYYETAEEAEATRNALHGVHWPIGNGKKLIIDYATPEDLEKARNPAPPATAVPEEKVPEKENQVPPKTHKPEEPEKVVKERERHRSETHVREWDIGKEELHKLRSGSREREGRNDRNDRRKHRRSPSPAEDFISRKQRKKEEDIPQKLMDDLFRKTKTTPSIYWLPLTPDEIATKQQQRLLRMAEHKRRMEESSRGRGDYGRGAPYRRRYD